MHFLRRKWVSFLLLFYCHVPRKLLFRLRKYGKILLKELHCGVQLSTCTRVRCSFLGGRETYSFASEAWMLHSWCSLLCLKKMLAHLVPSCSPGCPWTPKAKSCTALHARETTEDMRRKWPCFFKASILPIWKCLAEEPYISLRRKYTWKIQQKCFLPSTMSYSDFWTTSTAIE